MKPTMKKSLLICCLPILVTACHPGRHDRMQAELGSSLKATTVADMAGRGIVDHGVTLFKIDF